jgi:malonyl CoA-acyl carrier protein transacylase
MKVKDLVHLLQYKHQPDDDIVVVWYDREYVTDNTQAELLTDKEIVEQAWQEIIDESQESLEGALEFTQVGYEMVELFEERLTDLLQKEEN